MLSERRVWKCCFRVLGVVPGGRFWMKIALGLVVFVFVFVLFGLVVVLLLL